MQTRVISALLVVWLTACTSVPREPGAGRYVSGDGPPVANAIATSASQQTPSPENETQSSSAAPARIIAGVLLIALFVVAMVAGSQSLARHAAHSCCGAR